MLTFRDVYQRAEDARRHTIDFTAELGSDTISSATWSIVDSGPSVSGTANTTTAASAVVTGGTDLSDYRIRCTVTTAGSQTIVKQIVLHVRD